MCDPSHSHPSRCFDPRPFSTAFTKTKNALTPGILCVNVFFTTFTRSCSEASVCCRQFRDILEHLSSAPVRAPHLFFLTRGTVRHVLSEQAAEHVSATSDVFVGLAPVHLTIMKMALQARSGCFSSTSTSRSSLIRLLLQLQLLDVSHLSKRQASGTQIRYSPPVILQF